MAETAMPRDLRDRVRKIRIRTRKLVAELQSGLYRAAFRGRGIEFLEVREYVEGDDLRDVDWNVTARTGEPFVKTFCEERELTVVVLLDVSASMAFGSGETTRSALAAEICAVLTFAAAGSQDRVGLTAFSDRIESHTPPRRGVRHAMRVVRDILSLEPGDRKTDIAGAIDHLAATCPKRAVVFLVSDFRGSGYERNLRAAARRHDLVAVNLREPREESLGKSGLLRLRDPETGRLYLADSGSAAARRRFEDQARLRREALQRLLRRCGADYLEIIVGEPFAASLRSFMERRERRFGK